MVEIIIDGQKLQVEDGQTIIEAADQNGIYIPRFCYHKKLSVAANCRMCLVEVEKVGKPLPACATPISPGMVVKTKSTKALESQRAVMEYLLINHPLDCPICDQGGECELQDLSMGFGASHSDYKFAKRSVFGDNIGPLIATEMTRCIQCTRCVRFGEEVAGMRELGATGRGENLEIGTYVKHFLQSEISGNIIDLCPVGALTSKPARFKARSWEMQEHPMIAMHDCVGSHAFIHSRNFNHTSQLYVMRVVPRECEQLNETWLSDRDRFAVEGLYHQERLYEPWIKRDGEWQAISWEQAFAEIADRMVDKLKMPEHIAGLISPQATLEEHYLFRKVLGSLGTTQIVDQVYQTDFSDPDLLEVSELKLADFDQLNAALLVGSNLRFEQPIANYRLFKAQQAGAYIADINAERYQFNYPLNTRVLTPLSEMVQTVAQVVKAVADLKSLSDLPAELTNIKPCAEAKTIAEQLLQAERAAIILGEVALSHPHAALLKAWLKKLATYTEAKIVMLPPGVNALGGQLARRALQQSATNLSTLVDQPLQACFVFNLEPEYDVSLAAETLAVLKTCPLVVAINSYRSRALEQYADIILPLSPYTETAGTVVNFQGDWQHFNAIGPEHVDAKPGWKILRALARTLQAKDCNYEDVANIRHELLAQQTTITAPAESTMALPSATERLYRLGNKPMYRSDTLVRHSQPLQRCLPENISAVRINTKLAQQLNLANEDYVIVQQANSKISTVCIIDDSIADYTVALPQALYCTAGFGQAFGVIALEKVKQ